MDIFIPVAEFPGLVDQGFGLDQLTEKHDVGRGNQRSGTEMKIE